MNLQRFGQNERNVKISDNSRLSHQSPWNSFPLDPDAAPFLLQANSRKSSLSPLALRLVRARQLEKLKISYFFSSVELLGIDFNRRPFSKGPETSARPNRPFTFSVVRNFSPCALRRSFDWLHRCDRFQVYPSVRRVLAGWYRDR